MGLFGWIMSKKNGKRVVAGIFIFVLVVSGVAWVAQQMINANKGKPPSNATEPAAVEAPAG